MKKIYILILACVIGQSVFAQNNVESFKQMISAHYDNYFEKAELQNGHIWLYATNDFLAMPAEKKQMLLETIFAKWESGLIIISYGYQRELWKKDSAKNSMSKIDNWNMNSMTFVKVSEDRQSQRLGLYSWFVNFGGQLSWISGDDPNVNLGFSSRVGSFLLKNKWDLALSNSFSIAGDVLTFEMGPTSRVYFPIKEKKINPYVGLGLSYVWTDTYIFDGYNDEYIVSTSWNPSLLLGVSYFIGPGSLDFGLQISENFSATIGYTFMPKKH